MQEKGRKTRFSAAAGAVWILNPNLSQASRSWYTPKVEGAVKTRKQCQRMRVTVGRTRIRSFMIISTLGLPSSYLSSPCLLVFSARPFPSSMQFYAIKQRTRIRSFFSGPVYLSVARSEARKRQEGWKNGRSVMGITGFVMNPSDILAVLLWGQKGWDELRRAKESMHILCLPVRLAPSQINKVLNPIINVGYAGHRRG